MIDSSPIETRRFPPQMAMECGFDDDCVLCQEVWDAEPLSKQLHLYGTRTQRILLEEDHFVVMPDIHPLVLGHSLIVTKHHVPSLADLPWEVFEELERVYRRTLARFRSSHNDALVSSISFEHGPYGGQRGSGHCINHAHLHVVPLSQAMLPIPLGQWLAEYGEVRTIGHLREMWSVARLACTGYLFGETEHGQRLMTAALRRPVPSQYMRQMIGTHVGHHDWNWKTVFGQE